MFTQEIHVHKNLSISLFFLCFSEIQPIFELWDLPVEQGIISLKILSYFGPLYAACQNNLVEEKYEK